jgi:microcystin-dependent protein
VNVPSALSVFGKSSSGNLYQATQDTQLAFQALTTAGSDLPHNNMQPFLTMYFNIALQGVFPPRG